METNQVAINDPWDSAENPTFAAPEYWGLCSMDMYYCVLQKGVGKVRFDAQQHQVDQRRTAIDIVVTPLPEMGSAREASRSMIAESKEWASIVLPSIKTLGVSTRELNGKYVHITFAPTGRTYVKTNDDGTQETRDNTTIKFLKVFADENACRADWAAHGGTPTSDSNGDVPPLTTPPSNGNGNGADKEKATGLAFLRVIVNNACAGQNDLNVIRESIAANIAQYPPVAKFYTVDSPETMALIAEKMSA